MRTGPGCRGHSLFTNAGWDGMGQRHSALRLRLPQQRRHSNHPLGYGLAALEAAGARRRRRPVWRRRRCRRCRATCLGPGSLPPTCQFAPRTAPTARRRGYRRNCVRSRRTNKYHSSSPDQKFRIRCMHKNHTSMILSSVRTRSLAQVSEVKNISYIYYYYLMIMSDRRRKQ